MFLVDTSTWIDYFREKNTPEVRYLENILDQGFAFGITHVIYQELLQGAASEKDFNQLVDYLGSQRFYYPKHQQLSYKAAAELYFKCRKNGITIRSTIDCLIAQIAIEYDLLLLHSDSDFTNIHQVIPKLKIAMF